MKWIHSAVRQMLHILWLFPLKKNRIVFTAYKGLQFSCNPKYIFLELYSNHRDKYEFVWCLNDPTQLPNEFENVKVIPYKSFKYIYFQITSKVVVLNHANPVYIPLRKKQLKINTWHGGGAYKRVSLSVNNNRYKFEKYKAKCEINDTDYFVSACKKFTEVMFKSQMLPESAYLNSGMPRNDILFNKNEELICVIKKRLNIKGGKKIVLYAPTYRSGQNTHSFGMQLDTSLVVKSLQERFGGEWIFLLRTHISTIRTSLHDNNYVFDVTSYPDMQELLLISDVLISDYSSSIWDYALMDKPAFLFTPDLQDYIDNRGFYTSIDDWQYPYGVTNDELVGIISSYNSSENKKRLYTYFNKMGSYENGKASGMICDLINSIVL